MISSTDNRTQLAVSGTTYDFTFSIVASSELKVYGIDSDGVATEITTGFTVTFDTAAEEGTVTFLAEPSSYSYILMVRERDYAQPYDIPIRAGFSEATIEAMVDNAVVLIQQVKDLVDRALKFADTSTTTGISFPEPSADKIIGWNADGDGLENKTIAEASTSLPAIVSGDAGKFLKVKSTEDGWENVASASTTGTIIEDTDQDTKVDCEESADEDKVRIDTGGTQRVLIDSNGITLESGVNANKILDEDDLASDDDDALATQQSIKAYIDAAVAAVSQPSLGAWGAKSLNTPYEATTDGFVVAGVNFSSSSNTVYVRTDSANPPGTYRTGPSSSAAGYLAVCCPVKAGDYYEVETSGTVSSSAAFFIPLS